MLAYLPKGQQALWRKKLQAAYERPSYAEAKAALLRCRQDLRLLNASAVKSLDEGLEETLTLHRLGVFGVLGTSLKTTNCLESLLALVSPAERAPLRGSPEGDRDGPPCRLTP